MKRKKLIVLLVAIFSLFISLGAVKTNQTAQASTWYVNHSPYFVTHKVKLTKTVEFKKFKYTGHTYKDYSVGTKHLKKGSIIKLRKGGASYAWNASGYGMHFSNHYCWTTFQRGKWYQILD